VKQRSSSFTDAPASFRSRRSGAAAQGLLRVLRENGLSIVLFVLFAGTMVPMSVAGHLQDNEERIAHGNAPLSYAEYVVSDHFLEATMENWESEFLQMFLYVILTVFLFQKGSSESKERGESDAMVEKPLQELPWPVRMGGLARRLYENSLSLAFLLLFAGSFLLHAISGVREYNLEQSDHGGAALSLGEYFVSSRLWFESLQNWQSEFLSILAMVVLSIFLRQRGSPESNPVEIPKR
jgi:hypothetical protein